MNSLSLKANLESSFKANFCSRSLELVAGLGLTLMASLACRAQPQKLSSEVSDAAKSAASSSLGTSGGQPAAVFEQWKKHVKEETHGKLIQPDCMPRHYPAKGPSKGIVVLIHGFTACPQQFFKVAPSVADNGYDVFLPLLAGQGRVPLPELKGDYDLPKGDLGILKYVAQENRMNLMARAATGTKVIGGLSGGAALAAGIAVEGKNIWNRALIMAPFFDFSKTLSFLFKPLDRIYSTYTLSAGGTCPEDQKVSGRRNGLCEVSVGSMMTMLNYGALYSDRMAEPTFQIQFVGVESDETVSNKKVFSAYNQGIVPSADGVFGKRRLCLYKKGVPHSMLSRLENQSTGHWWMNSLEKDIVRFIVEGVWFPTDPKMKSEEIKNVKLDLCLVDD